MVYGDAYLVKEGSLDARIREALVKRGIKGLETMSMDQIREYHPELYADLKDQYSDIYDNGDRVEHDFF